MSVNKLKGFVKAKFINKDLDDTNQNIPSWVCCGILLSGSLIGTLVNLVFRISYPNNLDPSDSKRSPAICSGTEKWLS